MSVILLFCPAVLPGERARSGGAFSRLWQEGERLVLGLAGARNVLGSPTTGSVASAGSRSAPNTTALQLVRVTPCDLGAVSRAPEIAWTIALMYSQRLDCFWIITRL